MTIKELMKLLEKENPNAEILLDVENEEAECDYYADLHAVGHSFGGKFILAGGLKNKECSAEEDEEEDEVSGLLEELPAIVIGHVDKLVIKK